MVVGDCSGIFLVASMDRTAAELFRDRDCRYEVRRWRHDRNYLNMLYFFKYTISLNYSIEIYTHP